MATLIHLFSYCQSDFGESTTSGENNDFTTANNNNTAAQKHYRQLQHIRGAWFFSFSARFYYSCSGFITSRYSDSSNSLSRKLIYIVCEGLIVFQIFEVIINFGEAAFFKISVSSEVDISHLFNVWMVGFASINVFWLIRFIKLCLIGETNSDTCRYLLSNWVWDYIDELGKFCIMVYVSCRLRFCQIYIDEINILLDWA